MAYVTSYFILWQFSTLDRINIWPILSIKFKYIFNCSRLQEGDFLPQVCFYVWVGSSCNRRASKKSPSHIWPDWPALHLIPGGFNLVFPWRVVEALIDMEWINSQTNAVVKADLMPALNLGLPGIIIGPRLNSGDSAPVWHHKEPEPLPVPWESQGSSNGGKYWPGGI